MPEIHQTVIGEFEVKTDPEKRIVSLSFGSKPRMDQPLNVDYQCSLAPEAARELSQLLFDASSELEALQLDQDQ